MNGATLRRARARAGKRAISDDGDDAEEERAARRMLASSTRTTDAWSVGRSVGLESEVGSSAVRFIISDGTMNGAAEKEGRLSAAAA